MRRIAYTVPDSYDKKTVMAFLKGYVGMSAAVIKMLKRTDMGILLNGKHARTIDIINKGDSIILNIPVKINPAHGVDLPLDIVYIDDDVMAVNKPWGMPVHQCHGHHSDTLANAVACYMDKNNAQYGFHAVNRLDKDTTGLVLIGLNSFAASWLANHCDKTYYAVVPGVFDKSGTVDEPIAAAENNSALRCVSKNGARAVTHWKCIGTNGKNSLLEISLETGRTHQIRVHFSHMGAPLLGDIMYGGGSDEIGRQALHCGKITFIHPVSKKKITLECPPGSDILNLVK